MARNTETRGREAGFTLFELLVVLAILALLAAIVAPRVIGYLGRAKADVARSQMSNIVTALELYYLDVGRYPTEEEGLPALVAAPEPEGEPLAAWRGPYLGDDTGLTDPWGRTYTYAYDAEADRVRVISLGRDGAPGGEGDDGDLVAQ
ncbi:MAG: type II secretion system major pseudopilin GspG [Oceanicaulis sp.]